VKFRVVWFSSEKFCIQINEFFNSIGQFQTLDYKSVEAGSSRIICNSFIFDVSDEEFD